MEEPEQRGEVNDRLGHALLAGESDRVRFRFGRERRALALLHRRGRDAVRRDIALMVDHVAWQIQGTSTGTKPRSRSRQKLEAARPEAV